MFEVREISHSCYPCSANAEPLFLLIPRFLWVFAQLAKFHDEWRWYSHSLPLEIQFKKISCFRSILFFSGFESTDRVLRRMEIGFDVAARRNPSRTVFCENPIDVTEFSNRSIPIGSEPANRISAEQIADSRSVPSKTYGALSSV